MGDRTTTTVALTTVEMAELYELATKELRACSDQYQQLTALTDGISTSLTGYLQALNERVETLGSAADVLGEALDPQVWTDDHATVLVPGIGDVCGRVAVDTSDDSLVAFCTQDPATAHTHLPVPEALARSLAIAAADTQFVIPKRASDG